MKIIKKIKDLFHTHDFVLYEIVGEENVCNKVICRKCFKVEIKDHNFSGYIIKEHFDCMDSSIEENHCRICNGYWHCQSYGFGSFGADTWFVKDR